MKIDFQIIRNYLRGDATQEERLKVLHWIEESEDHRQEYMALRTIYDASLCCDELDGKKRHLPVIRKSFYRWAGGAAVALFCLIGGWMVAYWRMDTSRIDLQARYVQVPVGQRVQLSLSDGTKVWLNSNSKLDFDERFTGTERRVRLDGEAFFEVAHEEKKPFIVETGYGEIQVLGTVFNVSAYQNQGDFEVKLFEGSVRVSDKEKHVQLQLLPYEQAIGKEGRLVKLAMDKEESVSWVDGIYYFKNENYETVFRKIEEYYKIPFRIDNPEVLHYRCTCKFRQGDGIDHILKVLQRINPFEYQWDENNETITIY